MNSLSTSFAQSSFVNSILTFMERVEYRRVSSAEDLEEIDILRRKSYYSTGVVSQTEFGSLVDEYDHSPLCHVIGLYLDENLVGTVRLHLVDQTHLHGPTAHYFPESALKYTSGNLRYVDPSRLAIDPELSWQYPMLPLLVLRTAAMASEYFEVDHCMSFVRKGLEKSYRRFFAAEEIEAPRYFPGVRDPHMLLGAKIETVRSHISRNLPFFLSTAVERRMMFAPEGELDYAPMNILPSAKYAADALFSRKAVEPIASVI
jgi:hypothetical protein